MRVYLIAELGVDGQLADIIAVYLYRDLARKRKYRENIKGNNTYIMIRDIEEEKDTAFQFFLDNEADSLLDV